MNARAAIEKSDAALRFKLAQQKLPAPEGWTGSAIEPLPFFEQRAVAGRNAFRDQRIVIETMVLEDQIELVAPMRDDDRVFIERGWRRFLA